MQIKILAALIISTLVVHTRSQLGVTCESLRQAMANVSWSAFTDNSHLVAKVNEVLTAQHNTMQPETDSYLRSVAKLSQNGTDFVNRVKKDYGHCLT